MVKAINVGVAMKTISELIEEFLKNLIEDSNNGEVEVQRNFIAEKFQCVPSQINYVISTRFTIEKGFLIESKRGGGGYIRIKKMQINSNEALYQLLNKVIGDETSYNTAVNVLERLLEAEIITEKEYKLIRTIMAVITVNFDINSRDVIRANIMKISLSIIFSENE